MPIYQWTTAYDSRTIERRLDLFERFITAKVGIFYIFRLGDWWGNTLLISLLIPSVTLVIFGHRWRSWAILFVTTLIAYRVIHNLPYTINHRVFEALAMCLVSLRVVLRNSNPSPERSAQCDRDTFGLIVFSLLSVFIYSGIQKLYHGYYLSGEIFVLYMVLDSGEIGSAFRGLAQVFGETVKMLEFPFMSPFSTLQLEFPLRIRYLLAGIGTGVVLLEMLLPCLVWLRPRGASLVLMGFQFLIAGTSGEWDFGITGMGILLLLSPLRKEERLLGILLLFHIVNTVAD